MMTDTNKVVASESAHWYDGSTGEPRYTIIGANGKERATTLRDARKHGYVPSVTSVLQILAKPGLEAWKQNSLLLSAATMPHDPNMPIEAWCEAVVADSKEQGQKAMQLGTDIHGAIEMYLNGQSIDEAFVPFVMPVINEMEHRGWLENRKVEHSFAHKLGFGGKIDYHNDSVIIDFKTTSAKDINKAFWPEHIWQLSAYRFGIFAEHLKCVNIYISTITPGLISVKEWDDADAIDGEGVFLATLELWKLIKDI